MQTEFSTKKATTVSIKCLVDGFKTEQMTSTLVSLEILISQLHLRVPVPNTGCNSYSDG